MSLHFKCGVKNNIDDWDATIFNLDHYRKAPDYNDRGEIPTFRHEEPTPSYTSFGRLPKNTSRSNQERAGKTSLEKIRFSRDTWRTWKIILLKF